MAMTTPICSNIVPYPASQAYTFIFTSSGGNQVTQNQIEIQKVLDNTVVFIEKISNFAFNHIVPANTLLNNVSYKVRFTTYDINNIASQNSDWVVFKCLSTPVITISNISGIVGNQNYMFQGTYSQAEAELLSSYIFYLYNANSVLIQIGTQNYDSLLQQTFNNLLNNTNYYIEMRTISANGIQTTTGLQIFTVQYIEAQLTTALTLINDYSTGSVQVSSNVIQVEGISSGTVSYSLNDWIDVTNGMVYFQNGFSLVSDFTIRIWLKNITSDITFLKIVGDNGDVQLKYFDNKIHVYKTTGTYQYHIFSQTITPLATNTVFIWLQQSNNYLNIQSEVLL